MAAEHLLQGVADLADGGPGPGGVDASSSRLPSPAVGRVGRAPRARPGRASSSRSAASALELGDLLARTPVLSILSTSICSSLVGPVLVDADDRLPPESMRAWVRAAASSMRSLGMPGLDRLGHAAELLRPPRCGPGRVGELVGERLDVVAAAQRVDRPWWCRSPLRGTAGCCGRCGREKSVGSPSASSKRVGVQALGVARRRGHRLDAGADHVVVGVLRGERPARGLAVGAQRQRLAASSGRTARHEPPRAAGRPAAWRSP